MRSGSRPPSTGSPTSWSGKATPTPSRCAAPKAIGILAQPAHALDLLCQHQDDDWDGPAEPADPPCDPEDGDVDGSVEIADQDTEQQAQPADQQVVPNWQRAERADPDRADAPAEEGTHRSVQLTPPPFDPDRARAVIYVHFSEESISAGRGVARVEEVGPVLLPRLRFLLGDRCSISLKPVIDLPAGHLPVDSYEIPTRLREQLQLRYPADMFPYAATVSRRLDMDHTIAYLSPASGGPPGQTRIGNLGPHVRRHHNYKTNGGWQVRQPEPGIWLWRSPHRRIYLVNAAGTHPLGDSGYAQKMWRAARPPQQQLDKLALPSAD
jgi:hypothetical protein